MKTKKLFFTITVTLFIVISNLSASGKYLLWSGITNATNPWVNTTGTTVVQIGGSGATYATLDLFFSGATAGVTTVWMAAGTYSIAAACVPKANYSIYGGFTGTETSISNRQYQDEAGGDGIIEPWEFKYPTTINGSVTSVTYGMLLSGNMFTIDGITFDTHTTSYANGGAICVVGGTYRPAIQNCIVRNITGSSSNGIGIFSSATTNGGPIITSCLIENCTATGTGKSGVAIYSTRKITIKQCVIRNNYGSGSSGVISFGSTAETSIASVIANNLIYNNTCKTGGAIYISGTNAEPYSINNNTIVNNSVVVGGTTGGVHIVANTTNSNCGFYNNIIYNNFNSDNVTVSNLTNVNASATVTDIQNTAYNGGVTSTAGSLTTTGTVDLSSNAPAFSFYDATKIGYNSSGMDANVRKANFTLMSGSNLIDAGNSTLVNVPANDLLNNSVQGTSHDIGAFEYSIPVPTFVNSTVSKNYGDIPFSQPAASSTLGAITYSSGNPSVATIDSNSGLVTITGVGSAIITATQASNGNYGSGTATYTVNVAAVTPGAPVISAITPGDGQLSIAFNAGSNGGSSIIDYKYTVDGTNYISAGSTSSPIIITGLTNNTTYPVQIKAVNSVGDGVASAIVSATPSNTTAINSPLSNLSVSTRNGKLIVKVDHEQEIEIYNSVGLKIYSSLVKSGINEISLNNRNIYFVRIANQISKIIL